MNWLERAITIPENRDRLTVALLETVEPEAYQAGWEAWAWERRN